MGRDEDIRQAIIDYASKGAKSKFYFKDMLTGVKKTIPDAGASEVKKVASAMVSEEVMELLSTGSSTMYGLKGRGISVEKSGDAGG
ncbi:MAG: dissimilatory sulfite reductase D family protein [Thermodesulfovibrionales bacterium]|nr:dissimilatory sulfite reductase D family protein [Thermodesulfovibrionales bacterium]MDQ7787835.1 dissimilatory sulfite reductase D family protein [Thermodesulfovibrionales bacterium]